MSVFSGISDLLSKGMDKIWPDKAKCREQQTDINKEELKGAPPSRLRLWRSFLGWTLSLLFVFEVAVRPVMTTYWPDVPLPPSSIDVVSKVLLLMLGGLF